MPSAIKLREKLPLLLERVGVRRIKIRQKALLDPPHPNLLPEGEGTVHP
jgi:hypothetical protein